MADSNHTIPDDMAAHAARLINEAENMRQQGADSLKAIYADLREDLKNLGWDGKVISAEVAALKGAIAEMRLDEEKKEKRDDKEERVGAYISLLSRAPARAHRNIEEFRPIPSQGTAVTGAQEPTDFAAQSGDKSAAINSNSPEPTLPPVLAKAEELSVPAGSSANPSDDDLEIPAFLIKTPPKRPHCLNPEVCAGQGYQHCYRCTKAMADREAA